MSQSRDLQSGSLSNWVKSLTRTFTDDEMNMRRKCRIWWPDQLSSTNPSSCSLLFGWFISCSSTSLDVVVAVESSDVSSSHCQSGLQDLLHETDGKMPVFLQDKSTFSLLGQCAAHLHSNDELLKVGRKEGYQSKIATCGNTCAQSMKELFQKDCGQWSCGCDQFEGLSEQGCVISMTGGNWVYLIYDSQEQHSRETRWIPTFHHIHWNGEIVSKCDVHVYNFL